MTSEFLYGEGRPIRRLALSNGDTLVIDEEFIKLYGEEFARLELENAETAIKNGEWK